MNIYDGQLAVSGGVLHHIGLLLAAEESRCAWCHAELMRQPNLNHRESHGICTRHLEQMKADLNRTQRTEATYEPQHH